MRLSIKVLIITFILGAFAFYAGQALWPKSPDFLPNATQLFLLNVIYFIEALLFGFGIALFYFGLAPIKETSKNMRRKTMLAFISLCWLLVSWYPHDIAHAYNGFSMKGLVIIEYAFHLTLIVATLLIVSYIYSVASSNNQQQNFINGK